MALGGVPAAAPPGTGAVMRALLLALLAFYKRVLSPVLPSACRFHPSCSEYAREAIQRYGAVRGAWMAMKRLWRCRPLGGGGYDPVE